MSLEPAAPQRPLNWPPFVEQLSRVVPVPGRVYLVGGAVRDALRGRAIHDFDLATPDSGREIARHIANRLGGNYYTLDEERNVGRALVPVEDQLLTIDVAAFRGASLQADLDGRDFTINAMAVRLDSLDAIIDPLGGQGDLFTTKVLRQCSPASIADDPVRAIRAVRHSLQFGLRLDSPLIDAARAAGSRLVDLAGVPAQPERMRDEFFKLMELARPATAFRIMHRLGLLHPFGLLTAADAPAVEQGLGLVEALSKLVSVISPQRDDNTASDLTLGTAVMVLDRFRSDLQTHLARRFADDRQRPTMLYVAGFLPPGTLDWNHWATTFCLSNPEKRLLTDLERARVRLPGPADAANRRAIYRYFKDIGEVGVDAVLLMLAHFLASHRPTPNALEWGNVLEQVASPLLDAFFRRYDEVISPAPLLSGDDLQRELGMHPGPQIGQVLGQLQEEQAADEVKTRKEALRFAKRLLKEMP